MFSRLLRLQTMYQKLILSSFLLISNVNAYADWTVKLNEEEKIASPEVLPTIVTTEYLIKIACALGGFFFIIVGGVNWGRGNFMRGIASWTGGILIIIAPFT